MKIAILGLFVLASVGPRSLGVGVDVLPEAYTFAARRLNVYPDLRLSGCDQTSCHWRAGAGVEIAAFVSGEGLSITRLEADASFGDETSEQGDSAWFQKTCQGIVALVLPEETQIEVRSIADRISATSTGRQDVDIRRGDRRVRFYGMRTASEGRERFRCGVVAEAF